MIVYDAATYPQGSPEWHALRLGIPTASQFGRIISTKTLKPLAGAETYACELLAEMFIGEAVGPESRGFLARGSEMEAEARRWYEWNQEVDVEQVGFVLNDERTVGCSPDGLVGDDGLVEIKCPAAHVHVATLLGKGGAHAAQIQGAIWLTGRAWGDLMVYSPVLPSHVLRFERDEKFIAALAEAVGAFVAGLAEKRARLIELGCVPAAGEESGVKAADAV